MFYRVSSLNYKKQRNHDNVHDNKILKGTSTCSRV